MEKEPLFSAKNLKLVKEPLSRKNPVIVLILGVCSALAVTVKMEPAIVMGISVTLVVGFSNLIISLLRNTIPVRIRMIVQLVVAAALVILIDQVLRAFFYEVSLQLSVFVGLIITNCILMGRLEAFALGNKPWKSLLDGLGNGAGYATILIIVSFFRELLGAGTLTLPIAGELKIIPQAFYNVGYMNNGLMALPPMALIILGIIVWVHRARNKEINNE